MRTVAVLLVVAVLAGLGYYYGPDVVARFSDEAGRARLAGDYLVEDAQAAMAAIARNAESTGSLRGAGAGLTVKPSRRGARIYGGDGFSLVGSNGAIQARSPQHGVTLTLTPELRNGKTLWRCSSTAPPDRLTGRCR
jgi:hypothetical protein